VLEQQQESDEIKSYVSAYSAMKPAQAAGIFESMTDNLSLVARILNAMDSDARGKILGAMKADVAAQVTQLMEPK
jgi:flagellar motility protein MotE (MotC chaperone)